MNLWTLRVYSGRRPGVECSEVTCAIERHRGGYRLLLQRDGEIKLHESHSGLAAARRKAEVLLKALEWNTDTNAAAQA